MTDQDGPALCVFCRRQPIDPGWRPFCSRRCKVQDLARWAEGAYRVPGEPVSPDGQRAAPEPSKPFNQA
ncbi:MAG: DNA gyrase inhibitor YacG [Acidobacteria bacterium]|nr:DNA gyrase inhibitor YacG [Acidobacteriota bacterium]